MVEGDYMNIETTKYYTYISIEDLRVSDAGTLWLHVATDKEKVIRAAKNKLEQNTGRTLVVCQIIPELTIDINNPEYCVCTVPNKRDVS